MKIKTKNQNQNPVLTIADCLGVSHDDLVSRGVFNSLALSDEKVFFDPFLLKEYSIPEFEGGLEKVTQYFEDIITIITEKQTHPEDSKEYTKCQKEAINRLCFKELHGVHIGYSNSKPTGGGIGKGKAIAIEKALDELVKNRITNPKIAYLLPVISDQLIGADNISDMVIYILRDCIYSYTAKNVEELNISNLKDFKCSLSKKIYKLLPDNFNPTSPILLLPKDLLSKLPLMDAYNSYIFSNSTNKEARDFVDKEIIQKAGDSASKKGVLRQLIKNSLISESTTQFIIDHIENAKLNPFDYEANIGYIISCISSLKSTTKPFQGDFFQFIKELLYDAKCYFENNTNNILTTIHKVRTNRLEKDFQTILLGYLYNACLKNNVDISCEPESAGGRIDIKVSRGTEKAVIEIKLSTHADLYIHYKNQLVAYTKSEKAFGYYMVFDIDKASPEKIKKMKNQLATDTTQNQECIIINARPKISPSHRKDGDTVALF